MDTGYGAYMNIVEEYSFGRIKVSGKVFSRDLIIFVDEIYPNWWRKEGHSLCVEDLKVLLRKKPDILIIGTGYYGVMKVPQNVIEFLEKQGMRVIVENTQKAVETYNKLVSEGKNVAAAFHLTC